MFLQRLINLVARLIKSLANEVCNQIKSFKLLHLKYSLGDAWNSPSLVPTSNVLRAFLFLGRHGSLISKCLCRDRTFSQTKSKHSSLWIRSNVLQVGSAMEWASVAVNDGLCSVLLKLLVCFRIRSHKTTQKRKLKVFIWLCWTPIIISDSESCVICLASSQRVCKTL